MQKYSLLDLSPIPEGGTPADALTNSASLALAAEKFGYHRYWLAEHHNMPGIASAATSVVIGHVAAATKTIRVGAGGIMLPNHAPLVIAEQFGTLATLYPGRIDLGLGRAPGTDMATARALRRHMANGDSFPQDVQELMAYFSDASDRKPVMAIPGPISSPLSAGVNRLIADRVAELVISSWEIEEMVGAYGQSGRSGHLMLDSDGMINPCQIQSNQLQIFGQGLSLS